MSQKSNKEIKETPVEEERLSDTATGALGRMAGVVTRAIERGVSIIGGANVLIAGIGAAAVVLGGIIYLFSSDMGTSALTTLAVGGLLLLIALTTSFSAVRTAVAGRRGRYGTNTVIMILAFLIIASLVGFVAFRNSVRFDMTATKQFSLAPQTVHILKSLPEPVRATAFFVPGDPTQDVFRSRVDDLLHEFDVRGSDFSYRFVDPDAEPTIARGYNLTQYQTVVFEGMDSGRTANVITPPVEEQQFATALLIVTGVEQKQVYFITGHQEKTPTDDAPESSTGFGFAIQGLRGDSYNVHSLNLIRDEFIPDDAAVIIAAGPQSDLAKEEAAAIHSYLKAGGRAVFLMDPETPDSWRDLLAKWAVNVGDQTIIDTVSSVARDPRTVILADYLPSEITQPLRETYLHDTTAIGLTGGTLPATLDALEMLTILGDPPEELQTIRLQPLGFTSPISWLTPSVDDDSFDPNRDQRGPFVPAMELRAVAPLGELPSNSADARETRMVIFGDSDFASNRLYGSGTNKDLLLNSVNWLTGDINLISVRPKLTPFRALVATGQEMQFIRYSSWILLPLGVLMLGVVAWWRRR